MSKINFAKKKAIVVIHEYFWGPGHSLRDYLLAKKVEKLLFIAHPLLYAKDTYENSSRYELYENGKLIKSAKSYHWKLPEQLLYIKDIIYSLFWSSKYIHKADFFVGVNNLNAFSGVVLKSLGGAKNVIYYVIDYIPYRFRNRIMNTIYHLLEKLSAKTSDWTWNLSERMIIARENKWGEKFPHQLIVPHGVYFRRIKRHTFEQINKYEILFMGALLEKQGIQLMIKALPEVLKKIPKTQFTIVGKGHYEKQLKDLVSSLKLQKHVHFLGYIENHKDMESRMAKAAISVALYNRDLDKNDFTYYADPGKIKNYLGAGVPIVMTDVPLVARAVEKAKCGFIIDYERQQLARVLISFFSDQKNMQQYRKNAIAFAKKYEWDRLFDTAFSKFGSL